MQDYIPVETKEIVSNTATTITLVNVTNLIDGQVVTGTNIPSGTKIKQGGIDVITNTIELVDASNQPINLPTLTR